MSFTFKGGIHPLAKIHHGKSLSENCALEKLNAPDVVKIPMSMHIGAPSVPIVAVGDYVRIGQKIAESAGFVSVPCHASVSGTVTKIENIKDIMGKPVMAVVIENDGLYEQADIKPLDYTVMSREEIIAAVKEAGIVGMGGATFPLHVKLSPPPDNNVDVLIMNGTECEPFLTADHRLMLEMPEKIITGTKILMKALDVKKAFIGIEDNKMNAVAAMKTAAAGTNIKICELKTKYPQGGEKQLVNAITGREIPSGALPAAAGVVVANVASGAAVADAFETGMPLVSRITTVTGSVNSPKNFIVPLGTSISYILDAAGGCKGEIQKLISGGPMMGLSIPSVDCVATKGTSGVLVLGREYMPKKAVTTACISCGRCSSACPIHLMPMKLSLAVEKEQFDVCEKFHVTDCINCGSCSYVCPAKREVSQLIKLGRDQVMAKIAAERKKLAEEKKKAEEAAEKEKDN